MYDSRLWIHQLRPNAPASLRLSPELSRQLNRRALLARVSPAERDSLFADLSGVVWNWLRRYRGRDLAPFAFDDVLQESYLAFIDTHTRWEQRVQVAENGALQPDFVRYFLGIYPLLLANRVDALRGASHAHLVGATLPDDYADTTPDPWVPEADARASALIDAICTRLTHRDAITLRMAAAAGYSLRAVAQVTGESPRTLHARWARITSVARAVMRGQDDAAA